MDMEAMWNIGVTFDMWKKWFRAFGLMQSWAPAILKDDTDTPRQKRDLYCTLISALPDDDLSVIENVSEADKSCGFHAWTILVDHNEDGGIYEYHSIRDTWDMRILNTDVVNRDLREEVCASRVALSLTRMLRLRPLCPHCKLKPPLHPFKLPVLELQDHLQF
jgi:hypothetical protein